MYEKTTVFNNEHLKKDTFPKIYLYLFLEFEQLNPIIKTT